MHLNPQINAALAAMQASHLAAIDLSLDRVFALLAALGNPQERLPPVVHIAGTNGKGSTLAFLRAMAEAAGQRVHVYSSPHLVRFNERIVLAGREIDDSTLLPLLTQVVNDTRTIPVTFFEATTAAAFLAFAQSPADLLLLETGLGGRLDATNVVSTPALTLLSPIDYDHMEFLGNTLTQIAREKAGIFKSGVPCISVAQTTEASAVIRRVAENIGTLLHIAPEDWGAKRTATGFTLRAGDSHVTLPHPVLAGIHQYTNASLAAMAARTLGFADEAVAQGITAARWPARLQPLTYGPLVDAWGTRGPVLLDGGHNPHAAMLLTQWAAAQSHPPTLILGMMARKDAAAFLGALAPQVRRIITAPIPHNDSHAPEALAEAARAAGAPDVEACATLAEVGKHIRPHDTGTLLVAGSLFLAGELLKNHGDSQSPLL